MKAEDFARPIADIFMELALVVLIGILIAEIGITIATIQKPANDCYQFHVDECNYCHNLNETYYLCSGFCGQPDNVSTWCETDLDKTCEENIPHGCNLN